MLMDVNGDLTAKSGDTVEISYPLVNVYSLRTGKSQCSIGKSTINGHFQ
jgi:hypothetical protein